MNNIMDKMTNCLTDSKRRLLIDKKFAIKHVGYKKWDIISRNAGQNKDIWYTLLELGKGNNPNKLDNNQMIWCGDPSYQYAKTTILPKTYDIIAPKIKNTNLISKNTNSTSKNKSTAKIKPLSKADQIRVNNITTKIKIEFDNILPILKEPINLENITPKYINGLLNLLKSRYYEIVVAKMIIIALRISYIWLECKSQLESNSLTPEKTSEYQNTYVHIRDIIYEIIFGYNKYLYSKQKNGNPSICLPDLQAWIIYLRKLVSFDLLQVLHLKPELMFRTFCDNILDLECHKFHTSQSQVINFITSNQYYLALVHSMLGSGKTTMILPICGWYSELNKLGNNTKVLFCCPNEIVLLEVGHMAYNLGIPFGIGVYCQNKNNVEFKWSSFVKLRNSNIESEDINPIKHNHENNDAILYICDIYTTRHLLEQRHEKQKKRKAYLSDPSTTNATKKYSIPDYVLIYDEPTKDADQNTNYNANVSFSLTTELFINIMKLAPPKVILMSATLPTYEQMSDLYNSIINLHSDSNTKMICQSFSASESKIGCALITKKGELVAPHTNITNITNNTALIHLLKVIRSNPFVGRFYTIEILINMIDRFRKHSLEIPDIEIIMRDPTNATQQTIQQFALDMINTLIVLDNSEILTDITKPIIKHHPTLNLSTILTSDVSRFKQECIIYSADPVETAIAIFKMNHRDNIFVTIKFREIMEEYNERLEAYKEEIQRIQQKKNDSITKTNKDTDKKDKLKEAAWITVAKITADMHPVWQFPSKLQLGSVYPEDIPADSNVSDDILILLASGIGIYSTIHEELDEAYLKSVIMLAQRGSLKMIFSDSSIAYGTNLSVSDIILIDEPTPKYNYRLQKYTDDYNQSIIDMHSMKTVFQMLGRAGRGGNLSFEARVYTTSENNHLVNKLRNYIEGTLDEGIHDEVINIRKAYEMLWNHI